MNKSKSQNSILVLATLGVYLGLVIAGATPQVLANAAMTRQFDVKDEIEVKDDLDNKPDDERTPVTTSVQIYLEDVEYFLATLGRLGSKGRFDPKKDTFNVAQNTLLPCVDSNIAGRYTPIRFDSSNESPRRAMEYFSRGMVYGYSLGDCIDNNEFNGVTAADSRFTFALNDKAFSVNVAVKKQSPQRALDLLRELETTLKLYSTRENTNLRQKIIENTTFRSDNDQVFVVTHLPRAGLDALLATDAK